MFDIGWSEMAVIMLVALIVIGPRDLPRLARTLGQWVAKGRGMAREFQRSLEDMAREAELDDVKREIEKVGRMDIKKSIEKTIDPTGDLNRAFDPTKSASKAPAKASVAAPSSGAPNGEAKEPASTKPEVTSAQPGKTAKVETTTEPATTAKPKTARPKASAKPKAAEPKAAKPRTSAKPKTTTGTGSKPASSETGETETVAGPR